MDRYKEKMVALGNHQAYEIDYDETFASIAKTSTVHTVITTADSKSWPIFQMDVKNAFLFGDLRN